MKKTLFSLALAALIASCTTQPKQEFYEKHVEFPADATPEQKVDMVSRLIPTPQQLEWQQMEFTAFLHFGKVLGNVKCCESAPPFSASALSLEGRSSRSSGQFRWFLGTSYLPFWKWKYFFASTRIFR